ncbi:MAG TPA: hypothetical protein VL634_11745 [Mycobacterium sp.]|nr:hypothetical protein [Mycobacterium sp.]
MGFLDDARRLREIKEANPDLPMRDLQRLLEVEKHDAQARKFDDQFAPAAIVPYIEVVPAKLYKKDLNAFVKTYIGIVGLQPEDTFGIFTEPWGESAGPLSIVYRDRPEYADGRRRYRRAVLGE